MISKKQIKKLILLAPIASAFSLAAAYIAEYGFDLKPCQLCLYQRIPYAAIIAISLVAVIWVKLSGKSVFNNRLLVTGAGVFILIFLAQVFLASYHVGVEWGWFEGPGCSAAGGAQTKEEMLKQIMQSPMVSCKDPAIIVFGLSMAGWNALFAAAMAIFYIWYLIKVKRSA